MEDSNDDKKKAKENYAQSLLNIEKDAKEKKTAILKNGVQKIEDDKSQSVFRSRKIKERVTKLREKAGLSAFVGTSGKITSPRFKRGEFLQILSRELLLIGTEELKNETGGIISIEKLQDHFSKTRSNWKLREKDIPEAIEILEKNKLIPGFIDKEKKIVQFIPVELNEDSNELLRIAKGFEMLNVEKIQLVTGWNKERVEKTIEQLENLGLIIVDEENIYFPGL